MTLFCHSAPVKGKPRITVAGIVTDDTITIGVSRCSEKDQFVKQTGRRISTTRAAGGEKCKAFPSMTVNLTSHPIKQFLRLASEIIVNCGGDVKLSKRKTESPVESLSSTVN